MSVLTFVYPSDAKALALERLLPALQLAVPLLEVAECIRRARAIPDWSSLVLRDGAKSKFEFVFEVVPNRAINKRGLLRAYPDSPNAAAASQAPKKLWTQMQGRSTSDRALMIGWDTWNELIAAVAKTCKGVVEVPENERLYSAIGFGRYVKKSRASRPEL